MKSPEKIADLFFEVGMLSKTPRSGFSFLGSGEQSVAEHVNRVVFIGYALSMLEGDVSVEKVLKMCLFHDMTETRVSDLNYVHQKYTTRNEEKALHDLTEPLPFGDDIRAVIGEYEARETKEAKIAKDADQLEFIMALKEQLDIGNARAASWLPIAVKRLKTESARKLAEVVMRRSSDTWWFENKEDEWWVHRNKEKQI